LPGLRHGGVALAIVAVVAYVFVGSLPARPFECDDTQIQKDIEGFSNVLTSNPARYFWDAAVSTDLSECYADHARTSESAPKREVWRNRVQRRPQ
jgi:hypothetical protein